MILLILLDGSPFLIIGNFIEGIILDARLQATRH